MQQGKLFIVGTGIKAIAHITYETEQLIRTADHVAYLTPGPLTAHWITGIRPDARSLAGLYVLDRPRLDTYRDIVTHLLSQLEGGKTVCGIFYGHPGVFVLPAWEAIRQAETAGHIARMVPGISAEDCLFADLGVDPAVAGCQSYEATDFLIRSRPVSPHANLILWQVGSIGVTTNQVTSPANLRVLVERLKDTYPDDHQVVIYEAARHPMEAPRHEAVALRALPDARLTLISTLYIPPVTGLPLDSGMMQRLGLTIDQLTKTW